MGNVQGNEDANYIWNESESMSPNLPSGSATGFRLALCKIWSDKTRLGPDLPLATNGAIDSHHSPIDRVMSFPPGANLRDKLAPLLVSDAVRAHTASCTETD